MRTDAPTRPIAPAPIRHETAEHVICDASTPGAIPFLTGGLQDDGTYLYKLDLDQHDDTQDAAGMLRYIARRYPDLYARLCVRPSTGKHGGGYHLPFRTTQMLYAVKLYDPRTGQHAGELCDQRIELTGYTQGSAETIPLLTTIELDQLLYVAHAPGATGERSPSQIVDQAANASHRNERIAEGMHLIAGWETIRSWRDQLDRLIADKPMVAAFRGRLRSAAPGSRSNAYGTFVQSLMLHAWTLGRDLEARCAMVAAIAIGTGANGKEREKDYRIERDTAALITKIIHGDAMEPRADGTIHHWTIPAWVKGQPLPAAPAPAPAKRPAHRPPGDRAKMLPKLTRILLRRLETDGEQFYYYADDLDDWAAQLGVKRRAVQNYLADLETAGKIKRVQLGVGGRPILTILPALWDARKSPQTTETTAAPASNTDAHATPAQRTRTLEVAPRNVQCIEVEGAPKTCALPVVASGGGGGGPARAPAGEQVLGAPSSEPTPIAELGSASYDPARVKRRRQPKQPPKMRAAAAKRRRQAKLAAMEVEVLKERRWRLARRAERAATTAQAEIFDDLLAEMDYVLAKKAPEYDPNAYVWRSRKLRPPVAAPQLALPIEVEPVTPDVTAHATGCATDYATAALGIAGRLRSIQHNSAAKNLALFDT